jgi:heterodisulfide reductase subunit A2
VDCRVFIMDERAFNKEYSTYFSRAREQHGIRYVHCRVSDVREDPATGDLIVRYAGPDGSRAQERFEMVVLATGLRPPDAAAHMVETLGIELNEYGFCQTDKFTPLQTTRPGVSCAGVLLSQGDC